MAVETFFFVLHLDCNVETALQLPVKVYQVGIDVVQQRARWLQRERDGQPAAERFNILSGRMRLPKTFEQRREPTFASRPLQRRL